MRTSLILTATVLAFALAQGASASDASATSKEIVAGHVTKIDVEHGRVTVRGEDGSIFEFEASKETLDDLEVGDRIEAKKRSPTNE